MHIPAIKLIEDFVNDYSLKRADAVTAFDAIISFYKKDMLHTVPSKVQIITIPKVMAVYIFEFFNDSLGREEMYSTENFYFCRSKGGALEIRADESSIMFLISIMPVNIKKQ